MVAQPIDPAELLDLADQLASLDTHPERTTHLRRAVSTAYYAVFHELAAEVVMATLQSEYWDDTAAAMARWISHTDLSNLCRAATGAGARALRVALAPVGSETVQIAQAFLNLQAERHQADYDDTYDITPALAETLVAAAREAVARAQQLLADEDQNHRRFLALGLGAVRIAKDRG